MSKYKHRRIHETLRCNLCFWENVRYSTERLRFLNLKVQFELLVEEIHNLSF